MRTTACTVLGWVLLLASCSGTNDGDAGPADGGFDAATLDAGGVDAAGVDAGVVPSRLVNVQLTEIDDADALDVMVSELDTRGIRASIMVADAMATDHCDQLRGYDATGHEIMVYGRDPGGVYVAELSLAEQRELLGNTAGAIETCLGHPVRGFRSYQFSHDEDTWTVLDELGLDLNLSYIAGTTNTVAGHVDDEWPHRVPGYDIWAVPLHSVALTDRVSPLCDMPFRSATAEGWGATMRSEMDATHALGRPFKVLFHSYFSGLDEGRLAAFVAFLDHAEAADAHFVTAAELVELVPTDADPDVGAAPATLTARCDE